MVQLDFAGVCTDHQVSTNPHNWRDNEGFIGIFTEDLQVAVDFVRNNNNNNNNNIDPRVIGKRLRWFAIFLFRAPSPRQPPFEMHGMRSEKPVELQEQPHLPPTRNVRSRPFRKKLVHRPNDLPELQQHRGLVPQKMFQATNTTLPPQQQRADPLVRISWSS